MFSLTRNNEPYSSKEIKKHAGYLGRLSVDVLYIMFRELSDNDLVSLALVCIYLHRRIGTFDLRLSPNRIRNKLQKKIDSNLPKLFDCIKSGDQGDFNAMLNLSLFPILMNQKMHGFAPLHFAVAKNQKKMVLKLLSNGCDSNITTANGVTALQIAAEAGHSQLVKILLNAGAAINEQFNYTERQESNSSFKFRMRSSLCKLMLETMPIISPVTSSDFFLRFYFFTFDEQDIYMPGAAEAIKSALHYAVINDQVACLKLLHQYGASLELRDDNGRSPLHWAALTPGTECLEYLLNCGVDTNIEDREAYTAIELAVWKSIKLKNSININILLRFGCDIFRKGALTENSYCERVNNLKTQYVDTLGCKINNAQSNEQLELISEQELYDPAHKVTLLNVEQRFIFRENVNSKNPDVSKLLEIKQLSLADYGEARFFSVPESPQDFHDIYEDDVNNPEEVASDKFKEFLKTEYHYPATYLHPSMICSFVEVEAFEKEIWGVSQNL